jgi:DNA-binding NarL/FixJ family response regulator
MSTAIRVAHLDDHPAILAGFEALALRAPSLQLIGSARNERELLALVRRARPAVVVMDLHHDGRAGLELCLDIRGEPQPPAVVIYTAVAGDTVTVSAALAGAAAVVAKSSPTALLLDAIRTAVSSPGARPRVAIETRRMAATRLDPTEYAIFAMRLSGETPEEIARTLGLLPTEVRHRIASMLARLNTATPQLEGAR